MTNTCAGVLANLKRAGNYLEGFVEGPSSSTTKLIVDLTLISSVIIIDYGIVARRLISSFRLEGVDNPARATQEDDYLNLWY